MRILWVGNAPWAPSGYGEQAALFLPRFQAAGHEVAVSANFGLQGAVFDWNGITVYPADNAWGNVTIGAYADSFKPDVIVALCDAWVMQPSMWPDHIRDMAIWAPVDHFPLPPSVLNVLANNRVRPIAMSRDGEEWMTRFGLQPLYVPHGVDCQVFRPQREIRDEIRDELGIPRDAFLVGMVAANKGNPTQPRKGWPQAFHAFSLFAQDHPEAMLYAHTEARQSVNANGINLDTLAAVLGCKDSIRFADPEAQQLGVSRESLSAIYAAFDVLLNPAYGEGFGVPIVEAQACGVPVICTDHSAMRELTHAGWLVDGDPWWDPLQESFFCMPSIKSIQAKLEEAYTARDDMELRDAAVAFAQQYDGDNVMAEFWTPALEALARPREIAPILPPLPNAPDLDIIDHIEQAKPNRAERRRRERAAK